MQKHPMLTVKEAAEALKLDERSIRERLANGTLKGEKKAEGLRDKWYVYRGAVESALEKQHGQNWFGQPTPSVQVEPNPVSTMQAYEAASSQPGYVTQERTPLFREQQTAAQTTKMISEQEQDLSAPDPQSKIMGEPAAGLSDPPGSSETDFITDAEVTSRMDPEDAPRGQWYGEDRKRVESIVEGLVRPLIDKVAVQAQVISDQERQIKEQEVQLKLLPDYKKKAEDERRASELKELEAIALKKQMDLIAIAEARKIKEKEDELAEILEQERLNVEAFEAQITELSQSKIDLEATLQQEIERLKEEKEAQAQAVQNQLLSLTQKLERLEQPWWKKWFSPSHE